MNSRPERKTAILALTALSTAALAVVCSAASAQPAAPWQVAEESPAPPALTDEQKKKIEEFKKRHEQQQPQQQPDAQQQKHRPDALQQQPPNTTPKPPVTNIKPPPAPLAPAIITPKPEKPSTAPALKIINPPPTAVAPPEPTTKVFVPPKPPVHTVPDAAIHPGAPAAKVFVPPANPAHTVPDAAVHESLPVTAPQPATDAAAVPKPQPKFAVPVVKTLEQAKTGRVENVDASGRTVIEEADRRTIVRQGNNIVIQKDEAAQLQRVAPGATITRDKFGSNVAVVERPNNVQIITETDANGQLIRRFRRDHAGHETAIIDNRRRKKDHFGRDLAIGIGVGAGILAGAAILNSVVDIPEPVVSVPRDKYILRYEDASDDDVYEALSAPPVDESDRRYTLDEVRATPHLRDRMRRIDLDDINFETGSWDVDPSEYRKLERVARAMKRVIERNPNEVFLIEGYTDSVGSDVDNLTLSDRRAESVSVVLSEQFDVPFENLTTQGYGEQYLKIQVDGPERANRRVAVRRITPLLAQAASEADEPRAGDRDDEERYRHRRWRRDDGRYDRDN